MKILALDTTTNILDICLTENNKLISKISLKCDQNHSSMLVPLIKQVMDNSKTNLNEIDCIACCSGPGSFTGLRVGVSTAKALALSLDKKIISVPTLESLAYNIHNSKTAIIPLIDAKAGLVFAGFYTSCGVRLNSIYEPVLKNIAELLNYIKKIGITPTFVGEGATSYSDEIIKFSTNFEIAGEIFNLQSSYSLACIAYTRALDGKFDKITDINVQYMRKSQAEIQLEENS